MTKYNDDAVETAITEFRRLILHDEKQVYSIQDKDGSSYYNQKDKYLTDQIINQHLRGNLTIAVQLLQPGTNLAKAGLIDLDYPHDAGTMEELFAVGDRLVDAAAKNHLLAVREWSGRRGLHIWTFSDKPLPGSVWGTLFKQLCVEAGIKHREFFPIGNTLDEVGKGTGAKPIKLPLGIHRATGGRSMFLYEHKPWVSLESIPKFDSNSFLDLQQIEQSQSSSIVNLAERYSPDPPQAVSKSVVHESELIFPKLDKLPRDTLPNCIKYLVDKGAPDDCENLNAAFLRLATFCVSREFPEDKALALLQQMAENTSSSFKTSKVTLEEKLANAMSILDTARRDPKKYGTFHCNLIRKNFSDELLRQGGCGESNEPCWPGKKNQPCNNLPLTSVDELREIEVLAYCLRNPFVSVSKAMSMNIEPDAFRGNIKTIRDDKSLMAPLNRFIWLGLNEFCKKGRVEVSDVEIIDFTTAAILREHSSKTFSPTDVSQAERPIIEILKVLRANAPISEISAANHYRELKDIGLRQRAIAKITLQMKSVLDPSICLSTTLATGAHDYDAILSGASSSLVDSATTIFNRFRSSMFDGRTRYIQTASPHFNFMLNGGFQCGRLYGLGAPPKAGKTALLWWLSQLAAESGYYVIFCSYEIPANELYMNAFSRISQIDSSHLEERPWNTSPVENREMVDSISRSMGHYESRIMPNLLLIEGGDEQPISVIRGAITQQRIMHGLPSDHPILVVVDSLQRVPTGNEGFDNSTNDTSRISRVVKDLKWIARDLSVPVVAISEITKQAMSDAVKDGKVGIECFKGSSAIQHGADMLMVLQSNEIVRRDGETKVNLPIDQLQLHYEGIGRPLCDEEMEIRAAFPYLQGKCSTYARLSILMARGGKTGDILFRYNKAVHDFTPIDPRLFGKSTSSKIW